MLRLVSRPECHGLVFEDIISHMLGSISIFSQIYLGKLLRYTKRVVLSVRIPSLASLNMPDFFALYKNYVGLLMLEGWNQNNIKFASALRR